MFFKVITTIAVTVAIFVLAAQKPDPHEESDGIAIPLTKCSDTDTREFHATSHNGNFSRGPSGMDGSERTTGTPHPFAVQRDVSSAGLELTKVQNGIWYATISIGNPHRSFTVQLNTGFSDLFVPASTGDENCRSHQDLWNPTSSSFTSIDLGDFTITFADGRTASGKQYVDTVTIGDFTADSQIIGAAFTYSSALEASRFVPDGILGLGFPSLSQLHGQSPLFHTLFNERKLSRPMFSLKLAAPGGELYVGGTNTALYFQSTLIWTPVTNPVLWQVNINEIRVDGEIVMRQVPAIIETGSNLICGDTERVMALHQAGGGRPYLGQVGFYYTFPCETFPRVSFIFGRRAITLYPNTLNKGRVTPGAPDCFSGIVVADQQHTIWSIGTIFLEQFYTIFDFNSQAPRVGFAQLSHGV